MKFGIVFPNSNDYVDTELVVELANTAEENGLDFLLTWDHYMLPDTKATFDAWILLSYLAAKTSQIKLGTCVTPIPFRQPAVLAKMISTLDNLSDGRVILGVGAGWFEKEFHAFSEWVDDRTRVDKTKEGLELMVKLWTEDDVHYKGTFYKAQGATIEPKPIQKPYPKVWFGTTGDKMLRLAVRYGTGWIPTMISAYSYKKIAEKLRNLLGKTKREFIMGYNLFTPYNEVNQYINSIEEFRLAGCDVFAVNWSYPKDDLKRRVEWFAREVVGSF